MNLFVWRNWLAMKLILCFAALFAVYSIEVNAAPALQGHESVQADVQGLSSNLMDNLGDEGQMELQRIKRHSNDRNDFYVAAAEEAVNPETKKKKHPAVAKPDPEPVKPAAPAHEKPAHEKPPAEKPKPPPKAPAKPDPPKPDPPKQHPPKQEHNHEYHEYYQYQPPVHHYQFVSHDQHHPSQLPTQHHQYHYQHQFAAPPTYSEPIGAYREMDEDHSLGSAQNEYEAPSNDYAQAPAPCPRNVVVGCSPVVQLVPCSGHESHPYAEEPAPSVYPAETPSYREEVSQVQDIEMIPASVASQPPTVGVSANIPDAKSINPTAQSAIPPPLDKSAHSAHANLIDSDAKEVIIHADTTSTTEKVSEAKPIPAPSQSPAKTMTARKMEDMRKMAKQFHEFTTTKTQQQPSMQAPQKQLPQVQPAQVQPPQPLPIKPAQPAIIPSAPQAAHPAFVAPIAQPAMPPHVSAPLPQMMLPSHQHMVGVPQLIGANSAGGSPTQSMYYQNFQYPQ